MKTVAIVSQKGGAGKTTLALHLATAAHAAGLATMVLDMDPQGTAEAWGSWRTADDPVVVSAKASLLTATLERYRKAGARFVVIDTPPLAQVEAVEAAKAADLILIPCRPSAFDLHAIRLTANLAKSAGRPAFVIFNGGPPRASLVYKEAAELVAQIGLPVAPIRFSDRAAFRQASGSGQAAQEIEPDGKAANEVAELWAWVHSQLMSNVAMVPA